MEKTFIPLSNLVDGFAPYNRTNNKSARTVSYTERVGLVQGLAGEEPR